MTLGSHTAFPCYFSSVTMYQFPKPEQSLHSPGTGRSVLQAKGQCDNTVSWKFIVLSRNVWVSF